MTDPLRCAIYLRVSLDVTGEQLAVQRQRADCLRIAHQRGWQVVDEFVDNSVSASDKRKARPEYDRLVAAYEAGGFDALVCWDLDRLTRQPRQLEDWIDAAQDRGLLLVTANGEADLSTDGGRMFARIKATVARGEIERNPSAGTCPPRPWDRGSRRTGRQEPEPSPASTYASGGMTSNAVRPVRQITSADRADTANDFA